jgi:hypothetical protein
MICSSCGKRMDNSKGESLAGMKINLDFTAASPSMRELFEESLGHYFTGVYKMEFHLCYECWLESLGVK